MFETTVILPPGVGYPGSVLLGWRVSGRSGREFRGAHFEAPLSQFWHIWPENDPKIIPGIVDIVDNVSSVNSVHNVHNAKNEDWDGIGMGKGWDWDGIGMGF